MVHILVSAIMIGQMTCMVKNNIFELWSRKYLHVLMYMGFYSHKIVEWLLKPTEKFKCDPFFIFITIICCKFFMFIASLAISLGGKHIKKYSSSKV
jgi:hypothetical protein